MTKKKNNRRYLKSRDANQGKNFKLSTQQLLLSDNSGKRDDEHPVFCFRYIQKKYGIDECNHKQAVQLIRTLEKLSCMSWKQINKTSKEGCGWEKINSKAINGALPNQPCFAGLDYFLSFRLGLGKNAVIIGCRKPCTSIFHIIWIDPNGKVYNHGS